MLQPNNNHLIACSVRPSPRSSGLPFHERDRENFKNRPHSLFIFYLITFIPQSRSPAIDESFNFSHNTMSIAAGEDTETVSNRHCGCCPIQRHFAKVIQCTSILHPASPKEQAVDRNLSARPNFWLRIRKWTALCARQRPSRRTSTVQAPKTLHK